MNQKWFGFDIFVLMFSSAGILFFILLAASAPFITIPNVPKQVMYLGIGLGWGIAIVLATMSILRLYHASTKIMIVEQTKPDLNKEEKDGS